LPLRIAPLLLTMSRCPFTCCPAPHHTRKTALRQESSALGTKGQQGVKLLEDLCCGALEEPRAALKLGARLADTLPPAQGGVARTEPSPSCSFCAGARGRSKPTPWEESKTPRTWSACVVGLRPHRQERRCRTALCHDVELATSSISETRVVNLCL
jgi:hypothetical protein